MKLLNKNNPKALSENIIEFWDNLQECMEEAHELVERTSERQRFYPDTDAIPENERVHLYELVGKLRAFQLMLALFLDIFTDARSLAPKGEKDASVEGQEAQKKESKKDQRRVN